MLVNNHLILLHYSMEEIHRYIFSYKTHFQSYYVNPILSPYFTICIDLGPPQIIPILIFLHDTFGFFIRFFILINVIFIEILETLY